MGQSCELMAKQWKVTREEQDELAYESHRRAAAAYETGFYSDLVIEFQGIKADNNVRRDTSIERLATLKPSFDFTGAGTLTAGNSTPMTDGASAVLLASEEWARARKLPVQSYLRYGKVAAVDFVSKEGLLMAPAYAVARMLSDAGLTQRLAQGSGELVDWLADAAQIDFDVGTRLFGHSRRRSHTWKGDLTIVDFLVQAVGGQKNIRILFSMPVLCLATDEHGAVTGVETPSGVIEGRKVILATGGFGASPEFLARYIPKAVDIPFPGHFGSTGDGLGMGMAVGAATENLGAFQPFPTYIAPFACEVSPDVAVLGGILVDQRGRRFVNESQFPGGLGAKMLELPGKHAYEIFDERIFELNRVGLDHVATTGALEKAESAGR